MVEYLDPRELDDPEDEEIAEFMVDPDNATEDVFLVGPEAPNNWDESLMQ